MSSCDLLLTVGTVNARSFLCLTVSRTIYVVFNIYLFAHLAADTWCEMGPGANKGISYIFAG
jgi:hypothetical protein